MTSDGSDLNNVQAEHTAMAEKLAGRLMGTHEVASVNNGFPPKDYAAINPESYRVAIVSGAIALEDTNFAQLGSALEDIYGPPQFQSIAQTFGATVSQQDIQHTTQFDLDLENKLS